jgi:cytochrome b561
MGMTPSYQITSGIVLLTVVAIAYGGTFMLRVVNGGVPTNDLQRSYFRAGHAHAGVLVTLGLVVILLLGAGKDVPSWSRTLGDFVLFAAILMPAGFFLSVIGRDPQRPNRLKILIWLGALSLTVGVVGAGIGLIVAGTSA